MNLKYYRQEKMYTCGAAATRMVLGYYNIKKSEETVSKGVKSSIQGTDFSNVKKYVEALGLNCKIIQVLDKERGLEQLKDHLKNKRPVIITVDRFVYDNNTPRIKEKVHWESKKYSYHIIVVYDFNKKGISIKDPHEFIGDSIIPLDKFLEAWYNKDYPGLMVLITR